MKIYLVWNSSKGEKDLAIIYDDVRRAKAFCKGFNHEAKARGIERRAYIVEYEISDNAPFYNHKELKED